ncbi:MAG: hypothetical protein Q9221_002221 [Calogaya cf. arnoldii]
MTIAALPSQTVRAIGSTQALTDSASLIKELVDNALDAQSTSVTVEISSNALDIIQVKDNGHGIAPLDRPLVCKRYCTSKIKDLHDLANIRGASLGFRGEALASAAELSGGLTVTTRIVGEATAASLKVGQNGEVTNEERVSHAVGTTVRITDFLKSIPVRRQTALKESAKQLAKIKRTLQAYALARPSVRLSLSVLKAKSDKSNWIYAPKSDESVLDAAVKVVGKKVTDQCGWVVWTPNTRLAEAGATEGDRPTTATTETTYQVKALRPNSDAGKSTLPPRLLHVKIPKDPAAISSVGQYLSVDSRPISCTRGTLKQIVQLYKSYVRSSCNPSTKQKLTDPFLCMNLICPPGSYDANVEPAKDDVLFTNSPNVLEVVEAFLKSQYGEIQPKTKQAVTSKSTANDVRNFDLLLARKPPLASTQPSTSKSMHRDIMDSSIAPVVDNSASKPTGADRVPARSQPPTDEIIIDRIGGVRHWAAEGPSEAALSFSTDLANNAAHTRQGLNSHEIEEEPSSNNGPSRSHYPEDEDDLRDINVSNPWTFAKLNAPIRPQRPTASGTNSVSRNQQLLTPAKEHGTLGDDLFSPEVPSESITNPNFPTPARSQNGTIQQASSPETFPYPLKRWGKAQREADLRQESSPDEEHSSPTRLDTWIQRAPPHADLASQASSHGQDDLLAPRPQRDFLPASEIPLGTPLNAIPDISQAPRRKAVPRKQQQQTSSKAVNKPFKPPAVQDSTRAWFDHLDDPSTRLSKPNKGRIDNSLPARSPDPITANDLDHDPISDNENTSPGHQNHHPGLAQTMDYEARKTAAIAQRRALLLRQQSSSQTSGQQSHLSLSPEQGTQIKISPSQQSSSSLPSSSPHQNRYNSAIAALHTPQTTRTPNPNAALSLLADAATASPQVTTEMEGVEKLEPKDPRAYLMRTRKPDDGKVKRIRSGFLPLETPSAIGEDGVRDSTLVLDTNDQHRTFSKRSISVHADDDMKAFENVGDEETIIWERNLMNLLCKRYPSDIVRYIDTATILDSIRQRLDARAQ